MLIVLYKWNFYIYFIELVSLNTELYPKASACFYVQMFSCNHNTHWIQDGYIEAKQVERSQRRGTTLVCAHLRILMDFQYAFIKLSFAGIFIF